MAIIPANRLPFGGSWSGNVGIPPLSAGFPFGQAGGGIPPRTTVTQTVSASLGNGSTDATSAIQNAINATTPGTACLIPAGTYVVSSTLKSVSNVTLRGVGDTTILKPNFSGNVFHIGVGSVNGHYSDPPASNGYSNPTSWTGGLAQGSTVLTVASVANLSVGQMIVLQQYDDPSIIWTGSAFDNTWFTSGGTSGSPTQSMKETKVITAISGNTITVDTPVIWTAWAAKWNPTVSSFGNPAFQHQGFGLESMMIDSSFVNPNNAETCFIEQAYGCWLKDIYSYKCANYHVVVYNAHRLEFRRVRFWDGYVYAQNCGGLVYQQTVGSSLCEDCIFFKQTPGVECDAGCLGNAFTYNFGEQSIFSTQAGGHTAPFLVEYFLDANHIAHGAFNLFEGNYGENWLSDSFFGSGSHFTVLRNRFHGTNSTGVTANSQCIGLLRWTLFSNVVGNILGGGGLSSLYEPTTNGYSGFPIIRAGYPNLGNSSFNGNNIGSGYRPSTTYVQDFQSGGAGGNSMQCFDYATRGTAEWGKDGVIVLNSNPGGGAARGTNIIEGNYDTINAQIMWNDTSIGAQAIPQSLIYTSKPSWFNSLVWPPFDPASPGNTSTANVPAGGSVIPAGYRYNNNNQDPPLSTDTTPPSVPANLAIGAGLATGYSIPLTWTKSTDPPNAQSTISYAIQRKLGAGAFAPLVTLVDSASYNDTGLPFSTTYTYQIEAIDAALNHSGFSATQATATTLAYADQTQATVPTFQYSYYLLPWKSYMDTWSGTRLLDCMGINFNPPAADVDATAQVIGTAGFTHARYELGWGNFSYTDAYGSPATLASAFVAASTTFLQSLQTYGLRPLITLNANSGKPVPEIGFNIVFTVGSPVNATSITVPLANVSSILPGYTGLVQGSLRIFPIITSINASTGVCQLSSPLLSAINTGVSTPLRTGKYHQLSTGGLANSFSAQTMTGWFNYTTGVCNFVSSVLGNNNFDVEVWNELGNSSEFLDENNYYNPNGSSIGTLTYTSTKFPGFSMTGVEVLSIISADAVSAFPGVRAINGFSNQRPQDNASSTPPGIHAFSRHFYTTIDVTDPIDTGTRGISSPANPETGGFDTVAPINSIHQYDGTPVNLGNPHTVNAGSFFIPTFTMSCPESVFAFATSYLYECAEVQPFPSLRIDNGNPHWRGGTNFAGQTVAFWETETNCGRNNWMPYISTMSGISLMDQRIIDLNHFIGAKSLLRMFLLYAHKGEETCCVFAAKDVEFTYSVIPDAFFASLDTSGGAIQSDALGKIGMQLTAVGRMTNLFSQYMNATAFTVAPLTVTSLSSAVTVAEFSGDGSAGHPDMDHLDELGIFPFQLTSTTYAIGYYVVTRNMVNNWNVNPASVVDTANYMMPNEAYTMTLSGIANASTAVAYSFDPLTGLSPPVTVVARTSNTIQVTVQSSDYPRFLVLTPPGIVPPAPTNVTNTAVTSSSITLSWPAVVDPNGFSATQISYNVSHKGGSIGSFTQFAVVPGTVSPVITVDTGLQSSTAYTYELQTTDPSGNVSAQSAVFGPFTTSAGVGQTPPNTPTITSVDSATSTTLTIKWPDTTDANFGSTQLTYNLQRSLSAAGPFVTIPVAGSVPTFVQGGNAVPSPSINPVPCTFSNAQTSGNTNIVWLAVSGSNSITSVIDTAGNAYVQQYTGTDTLRYSIWRCLSIKSFAAGNVVTVTMASNTFSEVIIAEYTPVLSLNSFVEGSGTGTGTSQPITTTDSADTIVSWLAVQFPAGTVTTPSGYTLEQTTAVQTPPGTTWIADVKVSSPGTYNQSWGISPSTVFWAVMNVALQEQTSIVGTGTGLSYIDTGLNPATQYFYRVSATNPDPLTSVFSSVVSGTTTSGSGAIIPAFVQYNSNVNTGGTNVITTTFVSAQIATDCNIVFAGGDPSSVVNSVTDTKGNIYTRILASVNDGSFISQTVFVAKNIVAATAGSNTVTVTFAAAPSFPDIRIAEFSGVDITNPVDIAASAQGTNTTASVSLTTTHAVDMMVMGIMTEGHATVAGAGYTLCAAPNPNGSIVEYDQVSAAGAQTGTAPVTATWIAQLVALRGASTSTTIAVSGIPSAGAFGGIGVIAPDTIHVTGISSAGAFGVIGVVAPANVHVSGIGSAETFSGLGISLGTVTVHPLGISSAETFGGIGVVAPATVHLLGIFSSEQFSVIGVNAASFIFITGISSSEQFGGITILAPEIINISGIASTELFGGILVNPAGVLVNILGIPSSELFGGITTHTGNTNIGITGISSSESFSGIGVLSPYLVGIFGIPSTESFSGIKVTEGSFISVNGIPGGELFGGIGTVTGNVNVAVTGISSAELFGGILINAGTLINVLGIPSSESFNGILVTQGSFINVTGIGSSEQFNGIQVALGNVFVNVIGISSSEAFGTINVTRPALVPARISRVL